MSDTGGLIPLGDEQAKAVREAAKATQEALKALQKVGGFLREVLGTVPEDLVGYLGGDWLKVRRAENIARIVEKARERLEARGAEAEQPSISVAVPLLIAAANESRDELQDLWARLLAAAADRARARSFRNAFIEAAQKMEPLDAGVLLAVQRNGELATREVRSRVAASMKATPDEIEVSLANLVRLELAQPTHRPDIAISPFGREFLRATAD